MYTIELNSKPRKILTTFFLEEVCKTMKGFKAVKLVSFKSSPVSGSVQRSRVSYICRSSVTTIAKICIEEHRIRDSLANLR
jgi:hypothetical protein